MLRLPFPGAVCLPVSRDSTVTASSTEPPASRTPHILGKTFSSSAELDLTHRNHLGLAIKASQSTVGKQRET